MTVEAQNAIHDLVLETERLRLRRFRASDVDAIFAIIGDNVAMQYYPKTFNRNDAVQWISRNLRRYREHGYGLFAVTLKDGVDLIGDCGVIKQEVEGETQLEVGYHFRRDQWGHGYATEAARACMGLAFHTLRRQQSHLADSAAEHAVAAGGGAQQNEVGAAGHALRVAAPGVCDDAGGVWASVKNRART